MKVKKLITTILLVLALMLGGVGILADVAPTHSGVAAGVTYYFTDYIYPIAPWQVLSTGFSGEMYLDREQGGSTFTYFEMQTSFWNDELDRSAILVEPGLDGHSTEGMRVYLAVFEFGTGETKFTWLKSDLIPYTSIITVEISMVSGDDHFDYRLAHKWGPAILEGSFYLEPETHQADYIDQVKHIFEYWYEGHNAYAHGWLEQVMVTHPGGSTEWVSAHWRVEEVRLFPDYEYGVDCSYREVWPKGFHSEVWFIE